MAASACDLPTLLQIVASRPLRQAVSPQTAHVLANLPEKVRVEWPHHRLYGVELEVRGWRCIDGEVQLRVRLTDGSIGCVPISWTNVLGKTKPATNPTTLTLESLRLSSHTALHRKSGSASLGLSASATPRSLPRPRRRPRQRRAMASNPLP
jgi:hypothetical protein